MNSDAKMGKNDTGFRIAPVLGAAAIGFLNN